MYNHIICSVLSNSGWALFFGVTEKIMTEGEDTEISTGIKVPFFHLLAVFLTQTKEYF